MDKKQILKKKVCKGCRDYLSEDIKEDFCNNKCKEEFFKNYVMSTIKSGNSEKIKLVLKRYFKHVEGRKRRFKKPENLKDEIKTARQIGLI
jgi:hypothetical protein